MAIAMTNEVTSNSFSIVTETPPVQKRVVISSSFIYLEDSASVQWLWAVEKMHSIRADESGIVNRSRATFDI